MTRLTIALAFIAVFVVPGAVRAEVDGAGVFLDAGGTGDLVPSLKLDLAPVQAGGGVIPCALSVCIPGFGSMMNGELGFGLLVLGGALGGTYLGSFLLFASYNQMLGGALLLLAGVAVVAGMFDAYTNGLIARSLFSGPGAGGHLPRPMLRDVDDADPSPPMARPIERASAVRVGFASL